MIVFFILSSVIFLIWIFSFIKGLKEIRCNIHLKPVSSLKHKPKVSIVIPARNEENRIVNLLESIVRQRYENLEVIVVDDNSNDNTSVVANTFKEKIPDLSVIKTTFREGWCGKNSALVSGFEKTSSDSKWILFIDADCELKNNSLMTIVDFVEKNSIDCLSLFPEVKSERFFERLLLPSIGAVVTLFNSPEKVNDANKKDAFLNGQFIFIRKDVYSDIGTHRVVKDAVLEDAALAKEIKGKGYRIFLGFGEDIFLIRMYESFNDFVNGWTKNLYLILKSKIGNLIMMLLLLLLLSYFPIIWLLFGLLLFPDILSILFITGYFVVLFFQMCLRFLSRTYPLYAILAPISSTIVSYIAIKSAYRYIARKGVEWKGRKYFSNR